MLRLQDVVAAAGSFHHLVAILNVVEDERRSEWVKEWLQRRVPGSRIAELDCESDEHKFYKQYREGKQVTNCLHTGL